MTQQIRSIDMKDLHQLPLFLPSHVLRRIAFFDDGSVIGFDELNSPEHPGETLALREVFGLDRIRLQRTGHGNPGPPSFLVIE
jgi:hypothetical protein